ncbi:hypothetical protein FTX61_12445 [Nitriliruptoraceae bacterium ZYF776]|nr:hypothetical protein [Profundirhabdus halotolerans]
MAVPTGVTRSAARGWAVPAVALHVVLLVDALRAWLPSVAHVVGDLGSTSPLTLVAFAGAVALLPLGAAAAARRLPPRRVWWYGAAATAAVRLALQATEGGTSQLLLSSLLVVVATIALVGLAAGAPSGHLVRAGVVAGLAGSAGLHLLLGTRDLLWRDGLGPSLLLVVLLLASLGAASRLRRVPLWWPTGDVDGTLAPVWTRGPAWPWLALGPAVFLFGVFGAVPARLEGTAGLSPATAGLVLLVAGAAAVAGALLGPALGPRTAGLVGAGAVLLGAVAATAMTGAFAVVGHVVLLAGVGLSFGAPGWLPGDSGPRRRAWAAGSSIPVLLVLGLLHHGRHDLAVPVPADLGVHLAATAVAAVAVTAALLGRDLAPSRERPRRSLVGVTAVAGLAAVVLGATTGPPPAPTVGTGDQLRVGTYNLAAGFTADGRFAVDELGDLLAAEDLDLVVLQEVDRGWLLNGGHDLLRLLGDRLGLPAVFAPAADDLWGNAVLSRHPVRDVVVQALPRGGAPMARSLVSLSVEVAPDRPVAIVGTHLHHVETDTEVRLAQARAVAAEASRLRGRGLPVAVLGDLNAELDAPELEPLRFLASAVPVDAGPTWPADAPRTRIDHILTTPDLRPEDGRVVPTVVSDHLAVVVTLTRTGDAR